MLNTVSVSCFNLIELSHCLIILIPKIISSTLIECISNILRLFLESLSPPYTMQQLHATLLHRVCYLVACNNIVCNNRMQRSCIVYGGLNYGVYIV